MTAGSTGNGLTFMVTAAEVGLKGQLVLEVPRAWTQPQAADSARPGFVRVRRLDCARPTGLASISGAGPWRITVDVRCSKRERFELTYGDGAGVTAPTLARRYEFVAGSAVKRGPFERFPPAGQPVVTVVAGAVDRLAVGVPQDTTAGESLDTTVVAQDAFGNTVTDFLGTVGLTSSDPRARLPDAYAFAPADHGSHTFTEVVLTTAGSQTVRASDGAGHIGVSGPIEVRPGATAALRLIAPASVRAGEAFAATVVAEDGFGNRATGYSGTVALASSDPRAELPEPYRFDAADGGAHTFTGVVFKTAECPLGTLGVEVFPFAQTLSASDEAQRRSATQIEVRPGPLDSLRLVGPEHVVAGEPFSLALTATDAFANVVTDFAGGVSFMNSDEHAELPAPYVFGASDRGRHRFDGVNLKRAGLQSVSVDDGAGHATSIVIAVESAAADRLRVDAPERVDAGEPFDVVVTAEDRFANTVPGYVDTVALASSDAAAQLPAPYGFSLDDAGTHRFEGVVLRTGGAHAVSAFDIAGRSGASATIDVVSRLTPSPVDPTVATSVAESTEFLYSGSDPIQTGVAPGTIEPRRAAVVRGTVLTRADKPLAGVRIDVLGHPEFGETTSRADGMFDMAVNGGGRLVVRYALDGYLPIQREETIPWQDYVHLPDVVLTALDGAVTAIRESDEIQVAESSLVTDADGTRQTTLLFEPGTGATMTLADGSTEALDTLHVRATELTVGERGPEAMPGELPPASAYTFATDLTVDEALAAGATSVDFDKPVSVYVDNFLEFPVGTPVPVGYFDRARGDWIPAEDGRVLRVLAVTDGIAAVDSDGDGQADDHEVLVGLGLEEGERHRLATLYPAGTTLWRFEVTHFTPWDCNWPYRPPDDARPPNLDPDPEGPEIDDDCSRSGSVIGCETQTLGERVGVAGTPFALNYRSDRVPGRRAANAVKIQLTGAEIPSSLRRIELEVAVAGQRLERSFTPAQNLADSFVWDGKDAYGRRIQGSRPATVRVEYVYGAVYATSSDEFERSFGRVGDVPLSANRTRQEVALSQQWKTRAVGLWDARGHGSLGGWTLSEHHLYSPSSKVLYLGDGTRRSAAATVGGSIVRTVLGPGGGRVRADVGAANGAPVNTPTGLDVGPDGSLFVADSGSHRVQRIAPDGQVTTVAGTGVPGFAGDRGPATAAELNWPTGVAVGKDGSLYIADSSNHRVRRVAPDAQITTVAGTGVPGFGGDGGPAIAASLSVPTGVAVGADGSLFVADLDNQRVRRVAPDGLIYTVAGDGEVDPGDVGDGGPATAAHLFWPAGVAVGGDGGLYIADLLNARVRRVAPDGIITTVAGSGETGFDGDGGPATAARLNQPAGVAVAPDGSLYIADANNLRVRRVAGNGVIATVAGGGDQSPGDGGPATAAAFGATVGVTVGSDGTHYLSEGNRVRSVSAPMPGFAAGDIAIPSDDGSEIYQFNKDGRHLRTLDGLTRAARLAFDYDADGRLEAVNDVDGRTTHVERDPGGAPTAIIAPNGQRTALAANTDGYLARIANPTDEAVELHYADGGLLTTFTRPSGAKSIFDYDAGGRLIHAESPDGGVQTLRRDEGARTNVVTVTSALGRETSYAAGRMATGGIRRIVTDAGTGKRELDRADDGTSAVVLPDGTRVEPRAGPDPRFGMLAPVAQNVTTRTPAGLSSTVSSTRSVTLSNPADPLSLLTQNDTVTVNGRESTSVFDADMRRFTETSPAGRVLTTDVDVGRRPVRQAVAGIEPVTTSYDPSGRPLEERQGERSTRYAYDDTGRLASITDPLERTTRFSYDKADRLTRAKLPGDREIAYTYDANGNLTSISPPSRPAHAFTHTPIDLTETYTPPDVGDAAQPTRYSYDRDHALTKISYPGGREVGFGYDAAGRLERVTQQRGHTRLEYQPQTGNLAAATAPGDERTEYAYDGFLPTKETVSGTVSGTISRSYDADFRIASESIDGDHRVEYRYDADGLLTKAGQLTLVPAGQNGLLRSTSLRSLSTAIAHTPFGEPATITTTFDASPLYEERYVRDGLGRITQKTERRGEAATTYGYAYDEAGRLERVTENGELKNSYRYDANGSRTEVTRRAAPQPLIAEYDDQDRLVRQGATTYAYTPAGDLASKTDAPSGETTNYEYDDLGALTHVTLPDGTQIDYAIDAQGRRIAKKRNGDVVQAFLYGRGLGPLAELTPAGAVKSRFIYATRLNVPDYFTRDGQTYRILSDQLGSPRAVVDAESGDVVQEIDYDEFGRITRDTNPGFQPFGFAGGLYDLDTGFVRFGARDYDADTGRWTARDPIRFSGGDANLYAYVRNDPVNLTDPTGARIDWTCVLLALSWHLGNAIRAIKSISGILQALLPGGGLGSIGSGNPARDLNDLSDLFDDLRHCRDDDDDRPEDCPVSVPSPDPALFPAADDDLIPIPSPSFRPLSASRLAAPPIAVLGVRG